MGEKIVYLHGLSSSGATTTAKKIKKFFNTAEVISPDIPIQPQEALTMLRELCRTMQPDLVMGTSMGAMFAQQMHGYKKILINPAFHTSVILRGEIGIVPFLTARRDGVKEYEVTPKLCEEYEEMESHQFEGITDFDRKNTFAFFGEKDTLVHGHDEYMQYYTDAAFFPGEHRLRYQDIRDYMIDKITEML